MVDLTFRKFLGHRVAWAFALALAAVAMWMPAGARAASAVPGVPSAVTALPDVPAAAQAVVGAALAQAGVGTVDRSSVATVPAPVPSAPPVSSPSVPSTPVVAGSVVHLSVPASAPQASASPIPEPAPVVPNSLAPSVPRPDPSASAARQPTGGVSDSDVRRARPHGRGGPASSARRSLGRGVEVVPARPIEIASDAREPAGAGGWPRLAKTRRVAAPPVLVVARHGGHRRFANAIGARTAVAATAVEPISPSVPASLPPGGIGGAGAGAGAGPAGAAAVALLVLAGVALLRSILPGLMSLDLLPWRSAALALQLERPG